MTDPFTPPSGEQPTPPPPYAPPQYGAPQNPAPQYGAPYGSPYGPPAATRNGFGVTAMVLGIVSLLLFWFPGVGLLLGILAIVFAVLGRKRVSKGEANNGGMAIAGLVMGIVGTLIGVVLGVFLLFFADEISDYAQCIADAGGNPTLEAICEEQLTDTLQN